MRRPITTYRATHPKKSSQAVEPPKRGTTTERGYGYDWRMAAIEFLHRRPLCECDDCIRNKKITAANVVDHIVPIAIDPELRMVESNWRPMAKRCHDRHTARTMHNQAKSTVRNR